jgi:hypothetical protein
MKNTAFVCLLLAVVLTACAPPGATAVAVGEVRVWLDHPREGEQYVVGETIPIRWHASAPEGIREVELRINGEVFQVAADFDHAAILVTQQHGWVPSVSGEYLIEAIATSNSGASSMPTANIVTILSGPSSPTASPEATATPVQTVSPAPSLSPTDTPMPPTNTPVPPTSTAVPPTSTPVPPTDTPIPPTNTPAPPTATPDNFGPPKPVVIEPKGNDYVDCPGEVLLRWQEPYDPSGIANYRVELFISPDMGASWNSVETWDPYGATELDVRDEVDCGNWYAWKIQARDGAGNLGSFELVQFRTRLP